MDPGGHGVRDGKGPKKKVRELPAAAWHEEMGLQKEGAGKGGKTEKGDTIGEEMARKW